MHVNFKVYSFTGVGENEVTDFSFSFKIVILGKKISALNPNLRIFLPFSIVIQ